MGGRWFIAGCYDGVRCKRLKATAPNSFDSIRDNRVSGPRSRWCLCLKMFIARTTHVIEFEGRCVKRDVMNDTNRQKWSPFCRQWWNKKLLSSAAIEEILYNALFDINRFFQFLLPKKRKFRKCTNSLRWSSLSAAGGGGAKTSFSAAKVSHWVAIFEKTTDDRSPWNAPLEEHREE